MHQNAIFSRAWLGTAPRAWRSAQNRRRWWSSRRHGRDLVASAARPRGARVTRVGEGRGELARVGGAEPMYTSVRLRSAPCARCAPLPGWGREPASVSRTRPGAARADAQAAVVGARSGGSGAKGPGEAAAERAGGKSRRQASRRDSEGTADAGREGASGRSPRRGQSEARNARGWCGRRA